MDDPFADLFGPPKPAAAPVAHEDSPPMKECVEKTSNAVKAGTAPNDIPVAPHPPGVVEPMSVMLKEDARDYIAEAVQSAVTDAMNKTVGSMRSVLEMFGERVQSVEVEVKELAKVVNSLSIEDVNATLNARFARIDEAIKDVGRGVQAMRDRAELIEATSELAKLSAQSKKLCDDCQPEKSAASSQPPPSAPARSPQADAQLVAYQPPSDHYQQSAIPPAAQLPPVQPPPQLTSPPQVPAPAAPGPETPRVAAPPQSTAPPLHPYQYSAPAPHQTYAAPPPPGPGPPPQALAGTTQQPAHSPPPMVQPMEPPHGYAPPYQPPPMQPQPSQPPAGYGAYMHPPSTTPAPPYSAYPTLPSPPPAPLQRPSYSQNAAPPPPQPRYGVAAPSPSQLRPPQREGTSQMSTQQVVQDLCQMGFEKQSIENVISQMIQNRQNIDLNVIVDRLMNGGGR